MAISLKQQLNLADEKMLASSTHILIVLATVSTVKKMEKMPFADALNAKLKRINKKYEDLSKSPVTLELSGGALISLKGELIGIIGPNGAGKSTLLKAIFGLVNIREGSISLNGEDITGLKANKLVSKGVAFVPQTNNVFPSLTIEENLEMGVFQMPKRFQERFDFVTSVFPELGKRRAQRAGSLSGGERQMVAMGRALMVDPKVLLLDEPSAGLSPVRQDEAFLHVRSVNEAGVTVIMVEQNARRCLQICDRAYVLDQGKDAYTGTGRELLADPKMIELYLGNLAEQK